MRAQNQQDLIYKRGQAGVTKASVTIVFDNSDRSTSPVGMEDYAQITVTRQVRIPRNPWLAQDYKAVHVDRHPEPLEVPRQWPQIDTTSHPDALPECATQHQQPKLPNHAGPDHQGEYHRDSGLFSLIVCVYALRAHGH